MTQETTTKNLLVELFVEELPPKALKKLGEAFVDVLSGTLAQLGLVDYARTQRATSFASPRRLAAWVPDVQQRGDDRLVSQKLMPVSVGLTPSGEATPA